MRRHRRIPSVLRSAILALLLGVVGPHVHAQEAQTPQRYGPQYGNDFSAVLAVPSGKFAEGFNLGFGAQGGMFYDVEPNVRIGVSISYLHFGINPESLNQAFHDAGGTGDLAGEGSVNGLPLLIYSMPLAGATASSAPLPAV